MNWMKMNGTSTAGGGSAVRSASLPPQPNYTSKAVQEALKHLASINLRELCNEAKVERCRATRDLRSCGRFVHYVLNSCGHASLCTECCQRCDVCPICRTPVLKTGNRLQLRLYYECVEAGLISQICEEMSHDQDEEENQLTADVHRLYSFFNVAIEHNLVSVVCHYITDVCLDEAAVSSDPVIAFLLDEVVVKDWVKRAFSNILSELRAIYSLEMEEMQVFLSKLLKYSKQVAGISSVLEVLESAFKDSFSAQLQDLQQLSENVLKTKQHMDIMIWCIRHKFLDNVRSRYPNFTSWHSLVRERKSAAIKRAWPDVVNQSSECNGQGGSLFIEDALENIEIEPRYSLEIDADLEAACLQDRRSFLRSKIEMSGSYPFENLRAAADVLFLHGSSDLVVSKQAIFLYYLFDRHWTTPEENWKYIIDDFAATFGIVKHSLLESFVFYLLDDHTDAALQEACRILPEICGPETYPKVARVFLERQNPETALMIMRWSGRDGGSELVSIGEAVTAVRVRVECGLLSEAFTYQRMLCLKVKENKLKYGAAGDTSNDLDSRSWTEWMEILVTEFCCLCIRRNLVDRIIELPWNPDEEKYLHRCLLDSATDDPSSTAGSILVVFYLQRYRYIQAFQVNLKLQRVEEAFMSENPVSEEVMSRIRSQSYWRTELVDKAIDLLPVVQQQQVRSGQLPEIVFQPESAAETTDSDIPDVQRPEMTSSLVPSSTNSILFHHSNGAATIEASAYETPFRSGQSIKNHSLDPRHGSSLSTGRGQKGEVTSISKTLTFGKTSTPFRDLNQSASRTHKNSQLKEKLAGKTSPEANAYGFLNDFQNGSSPYFCRVTANPVTTPPSRNRFNGSSQNLESSISGKRMQSERDPMSWNFDSVAEPMDVPSSYNYKGNIVDTEGRNTASGLRWRSDGTSDEEDEQNRSIGPIKAMLLPTTSSMTRKGRPRRRFTRR